MVGGRGDMGQGTNAERRIREVSEYCWLAKSVCMENRVTSTSKLDLAEQVIPPVSQLKPRPPTPEVSIMPVRSQAIFRPQGLVDSEGEDDQAEDIKPDMMYLLPQYAEVAPTPPLQTLPPIPSLHQHYARVPLPGP